MEIRWSDEQQAVIDSRGCNLLVSAAAGSGKTAVLTERIVKAISDREQPVNVERLLVVTFTRAAAAQMRERIADRLDSLIKQEPDNSYLKHQKLLLPAARISTIHSLCSELIKDHFDMIDIDPSYRMAEEAELSILKADVLKDVLEVYYSSGNKAFRQFMEAYAPSRSDKTVSEWILKGYEMSVSHPWPEYWLEMCKELYEPDSGDMESHVMLKAALEKAEMIIKRDIELLSGAMDICMEEDGPGAYLPQLQDAREKLLALSECRDFSSMREELFAISFLALSRKRQETDERKKEQVKNIFAHVRGDISGLKKKQFSGSADDMCSELGYLKPFVAELTELISVFSERYLQEKKERNILDFSDLEHYALKLLVTFEKNDDGSFTAVPKALADELSEYYQEVICDEYQDSNRVQEMILESLSSCRHGRYDRFMVGDVKQSIYRFRQADAAIFLEKYAGYGDSGPMRRIDLDKNYRSRSEILEFINSIFARVMSSGTGGIEYDDAASLKTGASFPEEFTGLKEELKPQMLLLDLEEAEDELDSIAQAEALAIADEIKKLTDPEKGFQVLDRDSGLYRRADYGDIVVLLRSVKGYADEMVNVLRSRGIPAIAELSVGFFSAPEIRVMSSLISIIDNPRQDIPLAAVLLSPIGAMSSGELAMIRAAAPEGDLWEAVLSYRGGEGYEKLSSFLHKLELLREASDYMPAYEIIEYAYELTGYYDFAAAMPGGVRRKANLDILLTKAEAFDASGMSGLFSFVRYLEQMKENKLDFGEASMTESDNVGIVSIHKSKGLEYPIVFVAGLGRKLNRMDMNSAMVLHPVYGIGLNAMDSIRRRKIRSSYRAFIASKLEEEMIAEELRILYVALTRAKEKLVLVGSSGNVEGSLEKWRSISMDENGKMSSLDVLGAGSFMDIIMPCVLDMGAEDGNCELVKLRRRSIKELLYSDIERAAAGRHMIDDINTGTFDPEDGPDSQTEALERDALWQYRWKDMLGLKSKYSVSELKSGSMSLEDGQMLYESREEEKRTPVFMLDPEEERGKAALKGSAFHRVMELLDLEAFAGDSLDEDGLDAEIARQIENMLSSGRLDKSWKRLIRYEDFKVFIKSPLGQRMCRAAAKGNMGRESRFFMGLEAGADSGHMIVVQGAIDAWFEDEGGLVLVDYKTDRVPASGGEQILVDRYRAQLDYYSMALSRSKRTDVRERYIYSVSMRKAIAVPGVASASPHFPLTS